MSPLRKYKQVMRNWVAGVLRPVRKYREERRLLRAVGGKVSSVPSRRAMNRYRVALIGAGGMGQDQCLGLLTLPQVDIVGVADHDSHKLERFRQRVSLPDARFYPSAEALL